jgi:hypothetical protein
VERVETADGPRFRSALAPHECALLRNMVTSVQGMFDERESAAPSDPLEQITGIRTGNAQPPEDATMRRLLPDFFKPQRDHPAGSAAEPQRGAAQPARARHHRRQTCCGPTPSDTLPADGGRFELTEGDANAWIAAVNDVRLALGT